MTRLEENKKVIEEMSMLAETLLRNPPETSEETLSFHLGVIGTTLVDISRSLAVIADKDISRSLAVIADKAESEEE